MVRIHRKLLPELTGDEEEFRYLDANCDEEVVITYRLQDERYVSITVNP